MKMVNGETSAQYYESKYMSPNLQKINITCDQITFNPLEETITIVACDFKDCNSYDEESNDKINDNRVEKTPKLLSNNGQEFDKPPQTSWVNEDRTTRVGSWNNREIEDSYWLIQANTVDKICLGVIFMLMSIWLTVFVYYEVFYEFVDDDNNINIDNNNVYTDDTYDRK